jgi:hypothetical protein
MKKIMTLLGCIVLLIASSCTKQYISPTNQTYIYDVAPNAWALTQDPSGVQSYAVPLNVNAINNNVTSSWGVIVAISYDGGSTYEQVPEVYAGVSYSFTYNAGNLTLYAQSADGTKPVIPTSTIRVKVTLVDSSN